MAKSGIQKPGGQRFLNPGSLTPKTGRRFFGGFDPNYSKSPAESHNGSGIGRLPVVQTFSTIFEVFVEETTQCSFSYLLTVYVQLDRVFVLLWQPDFDRVFTRRSRLSGRAPGL